MTQITSGESVEQVAYDIVHHVRRHAHGMTEQLGRIDGEDVVAVSLDTLYAWLDQALLSDETTDVIAGRIREHIGPRRITRIEELSELPVGSIIRAGDGDAYQKRGHDNWRTWGAFWGHRDEDVPGGDVMVIFEPGG